MPENNDTFRILYQDDYIVAIYKPADLLVHRSPIDKHETRFAVQLLRDQLGQHVYPVHRLDRPTAGVLVFALDSATASRFSALMESHRIVKQYKAIVRGWARGCGEIDYALKYKWDKYADADRTRDVAPQAAHSSYQGTRYFSIPEPVGRYSSARYSEITMRPFTGRKHQLRRHCAHMRHPIVGDTSHGDGKQNRFMREKFGFNRLGLVCTKMAFLHPYSEKWLSVETNVDSEFSDLLLSLRDYETFL